MFQSFADELLKIAKDVKSYSGLKKQLQPGDILLTSFKYVDTEKTTGRRMSPVGRAGWKAFTSMSRAMQGDNEHSAIYVGKGNVIETNPHGGAQERPLARMAGGTGPITAVRPDVDIRERKRAAQRARELIGTKYSVPRIARAGLANYVRLNPEKISDRRKHEYICSTLVGDAYDRVGFNPRKPNDALMPADFYRSDRTEVVGRKILR